MPARVQWQAGISYYLFIDYAGQGAGQAGIIYNL